MPKQNKVILSLNAGELSLLMDARLDQEKYQAGCRVMVNFYPLIHGGAERRPGTYFCNEVKDSTAATLITAFEFSVKYGYAIEIGNQYMRFYRARSTDAEAGLIVGKLLGSNTAWADEMTYYNGDIIEYSSVIYRCIADHVSATGGGSGAGGEPDTNILEWVASTLTADNYPIYEVVSPYLTADLFKLKFEQSNDVMWITHPDYESRRLSRLSLCTFRLTEEGFTDGPFLDQNTDTADTITASATTGVVTLTATGHSPFVTGSTAGHSPSGTLPTSKSLTGALFKILHSDDAQSVEASFTSSGVTSSSLTVYKGTTWDFVTNGTWTGKVILEKSYDDVVWEILAEVVSENNANEKHTETEENNDASYRMRSELGAFTAWAGTATCQISTRDQDHVGIVEITSVESATSATGTVVQTLGSTDASHRWSEGSWSNYRGWPTCVAISSEERLTYAGSKAEPLTIWGSVSGEYVSMDQGTGLDDEALIFTLVGRARQNRIVWMVAQDSLLIGTEGGEHLLGASSEDEAMTPTNVRAKVQSARGSQDIQAIPVGEAILFVQKGGTRVRELIYKFEKGAKGGYASDDLTVFSNLIANGGITDWDFQRAPDPMVWCTTGSGEMITLSYEREQNVYAWSRQTTSDNTSESDFESVCVLSTEFAEDQIFCIVERTIGGATVRYVETFAPRAF